MHWCSLMSSGLAFSTVWCLRRAQSTLLFSPLLWRWMGWPSRARALQRRKQRWGLLSLPWNPSSSFLMLPRPTWPWETLQTLQRISPQIKQTSLTHSLRNLKLRHALMASHFATRQQRASFYQVSCWDMDGCSAIPWTWWYRLSKGWVGSFQSRKPPRAL